MVLSKAVMQTAFAESFKNIVAGERNARMAELRQHAFRLFEDMGFPSVRNEDWKYTDVSRIAKEPWQVDRYESHGLELDALDLLDRFKIKRNSFTALNTAFAEVRYFHVPRNTSMDQPIEIRVSADGGRALFPRVLVVADAGSKVTIVETYSSSAKSFTNSAVQIVVGDNASVTHYRVQKESAEAFHVGTTEVTLGRDSRYDTTNINLGAALSRHDIEVTFAAEGGEAWVDGLYMLNGSQHADTHSIIDHTVPNCTSHQTYKGVLNDHSRGVFNGKVFVRENARGTDAQQSNKNLLLSNDARVDTKPQLEIFNEDVKCSHGATVGQLEEEELFYLLTRGLPEPLARNLLTYGFAEEVINKITIDAIKAELDAAVLNRLGTKI
jgi:Fe-S cluster assembly protein SufD